MGAAGREPAPASIRHGWGAGHTAEQLPAWGCTGPAHLPREGAWAAPWTAVEGPVPKGPPSPQP